eukprot:7289891-Prorocentrum_lima.AAC.1
MAKAKADVSKNGGSMFDFAGLPADMPSMSRADESNEAKAEAKAGVSKNGGSMFDAVGKPNANSEDGQDLCSRCA